jgi:hypothetical protein
MVQLTAALIIRSQSLPGADQTINDAERYLKGIT